MGFKPDRTGWIFFGVSVVIYLVWVYFNIGRNLWWDELISLNTFSLKDIKTNLTHYPDVNNHIFFNFLTNLYTRIIGIRDLYEAIASPGALRVLPAIFSFITLLYVFLTSRRFMPKGAGYIAPVILMSCVLFGNYALQLRGYALSMTCAAALLFHFWFHIEKGGWIHKLAIMLWTFALGYTIPSNAYVILTLAGFYGMSWLFASIKARKNEKFEIKQVLWKNNTFTGLALMGVSLGALLLAYKPIYEQFINEPHIKTLKTEPMDGFAFGELFPEVMHDFVSWRLLLVLLLILGTYLLWNARKESEQHYHRKIFAMLGMILIPFVVIWLRGDKPHVRTMIQLLPMFTVVISGGVAGALNGSKLVRKYLPIASAVIIAYCGGMYFYNYQAQQEQYVKDVRKGYKRINAYGHFSQADIFDHAYLTPLIEAHKARPLPVVFYRTIDRVSILERMHMNDIEWFATVHSKMAFAPLKKGDEPSNVLKVMMSLSKGKYEPAKLLSAKFPPSETINEESGEILPLLYYLIQEKKLDPAKPEFYVLTSAPQRFEYVLKKYVDQVKVDKLNKLDSYYHFYLIHY